EAGVGLGAVAERADHSQPRIERRIVRLRVAHLAVGDRGVAHVAAGPDALAAIDQGPAGRELPAVDDEQLDAAGTVVDAGGQAVAAAAVVAVLPAPLVGPGQVDAGQHVVLAEARVVARHGRGRALVGVLEQAEHLGRRLRARAV